MAAVPRAYVEKCKQNEKLFLIAWSVSGDEKWKDMFKPDHKKELESDEVQEELKELWVFWITKGIDVLRREYKSYQLEKSEKRKNEQESVKANDLL